MLKFKHFNYTLAEDLKKDIERCQQSIPWSDQLEVLQSKITVGEAVIPNCLAIHPMEGCDASNEGKPTGLTLRRYERFARGGAGLLWVEAASVVPEARANPRQLAINENNYDCFYQLIELIHTCAKQELGRHFRPYTVLQLTHSGRYSKPGDSPLPIIAARNPYLDQNIAPDYPLISDGELERLEDQFVRAAILSQRLGFDAVDIKSCHRYLNSELLSAYTREGRYGGSFENRTRFLLNIIDKIKDRLGNKLALTLRLNAYDAIPYPYGFGVSRESAAVPDLTEPLKLVRILQARGIEIINISAGNPYYNPHVGRPYDRGLYRPKIHALEGISNLLNIAKEIQAAVPGVKIVATGLSWLREFGAHVAAGAIKEGWFKIAGFGRQAFAYPDFARDIIQKGKMERKKCCTACSKCTIIMRDGGKTGCVLKDAAVYGAIYKQGRQGKPGLLNNHAADHV